MSDNIIRIPALDTRPPVTIDQLRAQFDAYDRLFSDWMKKGGDAAWMHAAVSDPRFLKVVEAIGQDVEFARGELETAEPKRVPELQATIRSLRGVLGRLTADAAVAEERAAEERLAKFRRETPLWPGICALGIESPGEVLDRIREVEDASSRVLAQQSAAPAAEPPEPAPSPRPPRRRRPASDRDGMVLPDAGRPSAAPALVPPSGDGPARPPAVADLTSNV